MALVFPVLLFFSSWMHEKERQDIVVEWVRKRQSQQSKNIFACFSAVLSQQTLSTEVIMMMMFVLLCVTEIKDLPIQRTYSQTDLNEKFVFFNCEQQFWIKLLFMLSKDLKQWQSSN